MINIKFKNAVDVVNVLSHIEIRGGVMITSDNEIDVKTSKDNGCMLSLILATIALADIEQVEFEAKWYDTNLIKVYSDMYRTYNKIDRDIKDYRHPAMVMLVLKALFDYGVGITDKEYVYRISDVEKNWKLFKGNK